MKDLKPVTPEQNPAQFLQEEETVEVLYQRLGDKWFAFSLIEDEVFIGSLTPDEIHKRN